MKRFDEIRDEFSQTKSYHHNMSTVQLLPNTIHAQHPPEPKSNSVPRRLTVDSIVGIAAGFTLSWFITPLDCAVMESMASSKQISVFQSLKQSTLSIFTKPHRYIMQPQFGYVFGTYSSTYLAKNYIDTICKATHQDAEHTAFYKFWLVFAVNGGLSVFWKDPGLARIIKQNIASTIQSSIQSGATSMKMTYLCWLGRDTLHMFGAAVLPDYCEDKLHWTHKQWQMAQLTFPIFTQLVTTPCHLLGLDYFNNSNISIWERLINVKKGYIGAAGVRMIRMWAPWSIGLLINRELRDYLNGDDVHEHD
eukprot:434819_1